MSRGSRVLHRCLVSIALLIAFALVVGVEGAAPASAAGLPPSVTSSGDFPRSQNGADCDVNSSEASFPSTSPDTKGAYRCIAEVVRSTRSGVQADCIASSKAVNTENPLYTPTECRKGSGVQAEAVGQARAIAQLNAAGASHEVTASGLISANAQWEVTIPSQPKSGSNPKKPSGRVDLLFYERNQSAGPVALIELRQFGRGTGDQDAANRL
ncbi:MAG: hypothetical protein ABIN55_00020, partial [Aeromicrobium sp.]